MFTNVCATVFLRLVAAFCLQSFTFHIHVLVRVQSRCKHFMIDQTRSGKFVIVGMPRVYKSLKEMVEVHKKVQVCFNGSLF